MTGVQTCALPIFRGIVAELGFRRKEIPYEQPRRRAGKTSNNFYRLYDAAMLSITSYTKAGLRLATIFGSICCAVSILVALIYLIMKLVYWERFAAGMAPLLIGMCFLGSVQIFFIGMVGEYVLGINQRVMKRPLVVEEERINFDVWPGGKKGHSGKQGGKGGSTSQLGPSMLAKKEKAAQKQQKAKVQEPAGEKMTEGRKEEAKEPEASQDLSQEASQAAGETAAAGAEKNHKRRRRRRKPKEQRAEGQFQEETDLP